MWCLLGKRRLERSLQVHPPGKAPVARHSGGKCGSTPLRTAPSPSSWPRQGGGLTLPGHPRSPLCGEGVHLPNDSHSSPGRGGLQEPRGRGGTRTHLPSAKHSSLAVPPLAVGTVSGNCTSIFGSYSPITPVDKDQALSLRGLVKLARAFPTSCPQLPHGLHGAQLAPHWRQVPSPAGSGGSGPGDAAENVSQSPPPARTEFFMLPMSLAEIVVVFFFSHEKNIEEKDRVIVTRNIKDIFGKHIAENFKYLTKHPLLGYVSISNII